METRNLLRDHSSPQRTVAVPQDIITASSVKDSSHCMIAEAVQREIPRAKYISVDLATIRFTDVAAGVRYVYLTPRGAQQALLAFDNGEKVEPFKFRLEGAHVLAAGRVRQKASLLPDPRGGDGTPPVRVGGRTPPLGPLATGMGSGNQKKVKDATDGNYETRTGRRREFGLRAIIR